MKDPVVVPLFIAVALNLALNILDSGQSNELDIRITAIERALGIDHDDAAPLLPGEASEMGTVDSVTPRQNELQGGLQILPRRDYIPSRSRKAQANLRV